MATVFETYPNLNVVMIGKKVVRRKNADIFCQVAVSNPNAEQADLSGVKLSGTDRLDLVEIAQRLSSSLPTEVASSESTWNGGPSAAAATATPAAGPPRCLETCRAVTRSLRCGITSTRPIVSTET
jgi:hypothetical protein